MIQNRYCSLFFCRLRILGPGFLSCVHEDWHPSMDKTKGESEFNYIGELPDDILLDILSRLGVRGAVKSRAVCRMWRNLRTFSTTTTYEASSYLMRYDEYTPSGSIVVKYQELAPSSTTKDPMVLAFDAEKDCNNNLHSHSSLIRWIQTTLLWKAPVCENATLTALYLDSVAMNGQDFENCTKKYYNLETLVVVNAPLYWAAVGGEYRELPRLKHLEFRHCKNLHTAAPNLESLKVANKKQRDITLYPSSTTCLTKHSLQLTSISLQASFSIKLLDVLQKAAAPQLEQMELNMEGLIRDMSMMSKAVQMPEFSSVKQLKSRSTSPPALALWTWLCSSRHALACRSSHLSMDVLGRFIININVINNIIIWIIQASASSGG